MVDEARGHMGKPLSRQKVLMLSPGWGAVESMGGFLGRSFGRR